ncbi:TIM-barrel domain-containing protein [Dysgonomonas sp. 520]|uniref:TIM-barrel domain-containing protein n=1 Tax=Dysgonomonas sp. 520 TaxID=2302931 RepID=UPI0013D70914|nr:TIM-barrel domain-containing protein [Dysgonomonas sp. 520]NDW11048.1 T9SS C-terminal target domain-containing protein [Dysgonomonas sp. 520]
MKKIYKIFLFILPFLIASYSNAQKSFLFDEDMAVFYPADFDSVQTLPSFAIQKDLLYNQDLPSDWQIKPVYGVDSDGKVTVELAFDETADLYGTGLVTGSLRRNGTNIKIWNSDNWGYFKDDGKCLYQSHPWIMGIRHDGTTFGIIADNSWRQYFDLSNPIKITTEGPSFRIIVIEKENPTEMVKALAELTGKIELPPLWALGYQQSRYSPSYSPEKAKEIADEFRKRQIPCDVIWMDIDYMDEKRIFTFDPATFSDPIGLNNYLHDKNFKAGYIIDPGVKIDENYFVYQQGNQGDHWVKDKDRNNYMGNVWPGECYFPDFTRPETRLWWASLYGGFVKDNHIDGAWNDMNEPGVFDTPEWTMPTDNIHRGGDNMPEGNHQRYHNLYGSLMSQATYEGILDAVPDKRPFILSRGNHLGAQRYCATWTGDNRGTWEHMRMSIPMSITLGLSGQPFNGPDVGGYSLNVTSDLLGHWMALATYYPFSRNHTAESAQEPWVFGKEIESVSRTALNRRYMLLPYFYTLFREASETGMPIMRPVYFADVTDLNLRGEEQAFLLGEDLLVIPRWANNVKLPQGDWDKLKLENKDDGYQPFLAIRPGAIVPMLDKTIQSTEEYVADFVTLLVNPLADGTAKGSMYNDAGNGFGYKSGEYEMLQFTAVKHNETQLKIEIVKTDGSWDNTRKYRIGYVTDDEITYSDWSSDKILYVDIINDNTEGVDISQLNKSMYIGGTFNEWNLPDNKMNIDENGIFVFDMIRIPAGEHELKFANQPDWSGNDWGDASGLSGTAQISTGGGPNITFTISETGNYRIQFNPATLEYTIQPTYNSVQTEMYVGGTFNNWLLYEGKMRLVADNTWEYTSTHIPQGNYELKFANTLNFSGNDWGEAEGLSGIAKLTTGGKPNITFTISAEDNYTIRFNDLTLEYSISNAETSINEVPFYNTSIYPNPVNNLLNIYSEEGTGVVEIFNISGQKMLEQTISQKLTAIDAASFIKGIYFVKIGNEKGIQVHKLLKE